jgi:cyclophilin family peptidyl-prolyl cis-trans isomerase
VAKRRRRELHHLGQRPSQRKSSRAAAPSASYKPGFPMNLLTQSTLFYAMGAVIMIGGVLLAALLATRQGSPSPAGTPTPGETAQASPTPTATPNPFAFSAPEQVIDANAYDYRAVIHTAKGDIVIDLFEDIAPNTVNSFVFLAQKGFYDQLTFHRVVPNFVVQAGDPRSRGGLDPNRPDAPPPGVADGPGYTVDDEPNELRNTRGMVSMAKRQGERRFGSQFFINLKDNPALDFDSGAQTLFYPFGKVIEGMDVVGRIAQGDLIERVEIQQFPKAATATPEAAATSTATP